MFWRKKYSSIEKVLLFLNRILNKDWDKANYEVRKDAVDFFFKSIKEDKLEIKNKSPITWENDELYIFSLYKEFLSRILQRMEYYEDNFDYNDTQNAKIIECNEYINKLENELKNKYNSESLILQTQELIQKQKEIRKMSALIEVNFF